MPARANISELRAVMDAETSCTLSDLLSAVTTTSSISAEVPSALTPVDITEVIATAKANLLFVENILFSLKRFVYSFAQLYLTSGRLFILLLRITAGCQAITKAAAAQNQLLNLTPFICYSGLSRKELL